ncbi:MAG: hypothetical protein SNJ71_08740 [Bacteroidales bacterium]
MFLLAKAFIRFRAFSVLCLVACAFISNAQAIRFYKESIHFTLTKKHFHINGFYSFSFSQKMQSNLILYPFPIDISLIDTIVVKNITTNKTIPYSTQNRTITFQLLNEKYDSLLIEISYRQKIESSPVLYILTTTSFWNEPLEEARYLLEIQDNLKVDSISYEPDKIWKKNKKKFYYIERKNFMPERDFIVWFKY